MRHVIWAGILLMAMSAIALSGFLDVDFNLQEGGEIAEMINESAESDACLKNSNPIFTNHITDITKVNNIVTPPLIVGGDLKTHSYVETGGERVPVYAPVNMTLISGAYYIDGPYRLDFQATCEVSVRFMHITEPVEKIKNVFPEEPSEDSRDSPISKMLFFEAGEIIGYTTGTKQTGNWDFGVYNSAFKNKYAYNEYNYSRVYANAVCPYEYFRPELRAEYAKKFNLEKHSGAIYDGDSFCE